MAVPAESNGQRRLIIALVVVVVILLVVVAFLVGLFLSRGSTPGATSIASASAQPATSASATASAPSGGPPISGAGSLLVPGLGSDPTAGRGNGPGCQVWVDTGWTLGACAIAPVNGSTSQDQGVAYVTEHKPGASGVQWRVFIMTTTATEAFWHTRLYYSDEMGGGMVNITVKAIDTTGGGAPDLLVGFRHNKTSGGGTVLDYDVIQRASPVAPLAIAMHRQLSDGSVVVVSAHVNDYESGAGGEYTKSVITFSGGLFHLSSTSQVAKAAVPTSLLP